MSELFKMTPAAAIERPSAGEADPRVATAPSRCSLTEDPGRTLSSQPQERGAELETVGAGRSRRPVIPSLDSPPGEHDGARPVARHGFPQKSSVAVLPQGVRRRVLAITSVLFGLWHVIPRCAPLAPTPRCPTRSAAGWCARPGQHRGAHDNRRAV